MGEAVRFEIRSSKSIMLRLSGYKLKGKTDNVTKIQRQKSSTDKRSLERRRFISTTYKHVTYIKECFAHHNIMELIYFTKESYKLNN